MRKEYDIYGGRTCPTVLTPTLDQLIGNGVAYTNAYTAKGYEGNLPLNVYMIYRQLFQPTT